MDKVQETKNIKRRLEKNRIELAIKDANASIARSEEVIKRIRNSGMDEDYVLTQIEKNKENIKTRKTEIETYNQSLNKLQDGDLDEEINNSYLQNATKAENSRTNKAKVKSDKKIITDEANASWDKMHSHKSYKKMEKDIRAGERYYYKVIESLPDYMAKNLKTMPNNKGYLWRGVAFYGELPKIQWEPTILFEKQGPVMVIHESTKTETRIYEKVGKDPKVLREVIQRKLMYNPPELVITKK